ncbi:MAG TPA: DUF952 domain-containing protein [Planctomycetota bacterium]|nr:DUF952 domain-containing protein [Planctomycetota bacterium]
MSTAGASPSGGTLWHLTRDGAPARRGAEGFVHCSYTAQLAGTIDVHFAGAQELVLLRLDARRLGEKLVVEPSRHGALFPHVYRELEDADVEERVTLRRGPDGRFDLSRLPA